VFRNSGNPLPSAEAVPGFEEQVYSGSEALSRNIQRKRAKKIDPATAFPYTYPPRSTLRSLKSFDTLTMTGFLKGTPFKTFEE
jgi:hypothetical protein